MTSTADERAFELVNGFRAANLVRIAAMLHLPDLLESGPCSAQELAAAAGVLEDPLHRMLRALAALGVVDEADDGRFVLTEVGDRFRDTPASLRMPAIMLPAEGQAAFHEMMHTLHTGEAAYRMAHGMTRWEHMAADLEVAATFQRTMVSTSEAVAPHLVRAFDFSRRGVVADIGGGRGALLAGILTADPGLHGILFDVAEGLDGAGEYLNEKGVAGRCRLVAGDFFEAVPGSAGAYLLKFILHDWPDADCWRILTCCRAAMPPDAALVVVERMLPERASAAALRTFMVDMQMLVAIGGRERTHEEYDRLLTEAGFKLDAERELVDSLWMLAARPV